MDLKEKTITLRNDKYITQTDNAGKLRSNYVKSHQEHVKGEKNRVNNKKSYLNHDKVRSGKNNEIKAYVIGEKLLIFAEKLLGKGFYRSGKAATEIEILYPGRMGQVKLREHYAGKLQKAALIAVMGLLLGIVSFATAGTVFTGNNLLARDDYGGDETEYELILENNDGSEREVDVSVSPREYGYYEAVDAIEQAILDMDELVLGENESFDRVYYDLNMPDSIEPGLIKVQWESSDYNILNDDGEIDEEYLPEDGAEVKITGLLKYENIKRTYEKTLTIYPVPLDEEEKEDKVIQDALKKADEDSIEENTIELPESINGKKVLWKDRKSYTFILLPIIGIVAAVVIYYNEDKKLKDTLAKRRREMEIDYSEILNKMVLLLGAGMTMRSVWERIALDYKKYGSKKRFAYEEMLLSLNEMNSGTAEMTAYEHFGTRCGGTSYMKLSATLTQNLKKGSKGLLEIFRQEAREANELRKNYARKRGEEAGTKLLIPMIMMLGVVLVIVMVPAFQSMNI